MSLPPTPKAPCWFNSAEASAWEQGWETGREAALEECAAICDRFADRQMHPAECAAAIRALKEKK